MGDFIEKAKEVCATANTDQPFMCLDVTYISVLLKEGYGLNSKTKVKVCKKNPFIFLTGFNPEIFSFAVVQENWRS